VSRVLYLLLLAVPAALIARALQAAPIVTFILAALALVPLAGLIGVSTEAIAERVGPQVGGLLNATFGNAAEIIIGLTAIAAGLPDVVRASIAGSIIGNALLVLGTAMLLGGWRFGQQRFDAKTAGNYASMLALVVIGLAIPSLLATIGETNTPGRLPIRGAALHELSVAVAVILLLCYVAYIAFTVFGVHARSAEDLVSALAAAQREDEEGDEHRGDEPPAPADPDRAATEPTAQAKLPASERHRSGRADLRRAWHENIWLPVGVLAGVTVLTALVSEALVSVIEPVAAEVRLSPFFVGLIIIPIVGNAAEHFTAITMAVRDHMEIAMAITAGSSIQVALLAAPLLVLASPLLGHPLDLNFSLLEVAIFGFVAGLYALISLDGESTWLEGLLLCAFYLILALGTFFAPA
jgi:Ca2+:H+ antiporter